MKTTIRRKTPVKNRPACELWLAKHIQANPYLKVPCTYLDKNNEVKERDVGIIITKLANFISILRYYTDREGNLRWHPRAVNHKSGKGVVFVYDRVDIPIHIAKDFGQAILKFMDEYGPSQDEINEIMIKFKESKFGLSQLTRLLDVFK